MGSEDAHGDSRECIVAMTYLMDHWQDMIDWLSYRHMVGYWLGLVRWRQGVYAHREHAASPAFRGAVPRSRLHGLRQRVSAPLLTLADDEGFYALQCAAFRQVQRERRPGYVAQLKLVEERQAAVIGERLARRARRLVLERRGNFEVKRCFDRELEVGEKHYEGNGKFEI